MMNEKEKFGTVYWITGLSGSGKTTIAEALYHKLQQYSENIVFLDGDGLREIFGDVYGHDQKARFAASMAYARLCRCLSEQGIHVVIATISLFHETQRWNREWIENYVEIYIRVPLDVLQQRDSKQIYSRAHKGELSNVVGIDIQAEEPTNPDIVVENFGSMTIERAVEEIIETVHLRNTKDSTVFNMER